MSKEDNYPVPVAEDNPKYFEVGQGEDGLICYRCLECDCSSFGSTIDIKHKSDCTVWLRMRMESLLVNHPKLKFQVTKFFKSERGSYPILVCHLVAPFLYVSGSDLTGDRTINMIDARAPIQLSKAEFNNLENREQLFKSRRVEATHRLLDFVVEGKVPVQGGGELVVWQWGTLESWQEEIQKEINRSRGLIG